MKVKGRNKYKHIKVLMNKNSIKNKTKSRKTEMN